MSRHIGKLREEFEQGSVSIIGFTFQDDVYCCEEDRMEGGKNRSRETSNCALGQEVMVAWSRVVAVEKEAGGFAVFPPLEMESIGRGSWIEYWEQRK